MAFGVGTTGSMWARFGKVKPTAFQFNEAWRQKRSANTQEYLASNTALADAFSSAFTNQVQGMGMLAAQAAQKRMQAAAVAMRSRVDKLL
jgi:hypothetical protein